MAAGGREDLPAGFWEDYESMEIRKSAIIGMGALGMLYGTHLVDSGADVQYVMDAARYAKYSGREFYKNGKVYRLPMCPSERAEPADLVIVAVKYTGLQAALDTMAGCVGENTIILSVMNGITSEEILSERFGAEHLVYCVAHGMDAMRFGDSLNFTREGELCLGAREPFQQKNVDAALAYLTRSGIACRQDPDIMHRLWSKFMLNVGINQCCMVYETDYEGCLKPGEPNRSFLAAMREVVSLARAEGVALGEEDINEYITIVSTLSPRGVPSMRQDALAKRPSEVEMFSGTVLKLAKKHGFCMPTNEFLYQRIREIERTYGT